jgi:hypothetical protein
MLVEVEKFNADAAIQDSIAVSKEAFSQNPGIWKLLREIAFSSVDGFGAKSETKAQVLPTVDDVVSDPAERFEIDPQFAEHLELQDSSIGFEQVAELRQKLAADLSASNIRIDQLREQLIDLQRQREAEAEAQRIADEQAAEEAEAQRVADEQAAKEAVSESEEELVSESEEELVAESEELIEAGNEEAPELSAEESQVTKRRAASKSSSVAAKKLVPGSSGSDDKPIDSKKRGKK